jgi:hypothetical protein
MREQVRTETEVRLSCSSAILQQPSLRGSVSDLCLSCELFAVVRNFLGSGFAGHVI